MDVRALFARTCCPKCGVPARCPQCRAMKVPGGKLEFKYQCGTEVRYIHSAGFYSPNWEIRCDGSDGLRDAEPRRT